MTYNQQNLVLQSPSFKDGWIQQVEEDRAADRATAIHNIRNEQKIQKKTYDNKVKRNR